MRILQIVFSKSRGGREMPPLELAAEHNKMGHESAVLTLPGSFVAERARQLDLALEEIPVLGRFDPLAVWRLRDVLKRRRPHLAHVHIPRDLFLLLPARWLAGLDCRIVLTVSVGNRVNKKDPLHRLVYSRVDKVAVLSDLLRRNLLETCPLHEDKLRVVYPGIAIERFQRPASAPPPVCRQVDGGATELAGSPVIGNVSRLSRGKGQDILLRALPRLSADYPDFRCYMIGGWEKDDEEYRRELICLIEELGLSGRAELLGHRHDLGLLLGQMDVFVFPTTNEAFGISVVEAMAAGVPCLATGYDGVLEIISDGENGLLFKRGDHEELAAKLKRLIDDKKLARRLARQGQKQARQRFSLERVARDYAELYEEVIGKKK